MSKNSESAISGKSLRAIAQAALAIAARVEAGELVEADECEGLSLHVPGLTSEANAKGNPHLDFEAVLFPKSAAPARRAKQVARTIETLQEVAWAAICLARQMDRGALVNSHAPSAFLIGENVNGDIHMDVQVVLSLAIRAPARKVKLATRATGGRAAA